MTATAPPPMVPSAPVAPWMPNPPGAPAASEFQGVRRARSAAVMDIVALLVVLVGPVALLVVTGTHVLVRGVSLGSGTGQFTVTDFEDVIGVILVGALISLVGVLLYVLSFSALRKTHSGFGGPMGLGIVGIVGVLIVIGGLGGYLYEVYQAVACTSTASVTACVNFNSLFYLETLLLFGLLLTFLGVIGLLIGIYRIGSRYNSTITKVGGIFYILPGLSLVAPFLVLAGAQGILRQLRTRAQSSNPAQAPATPP
ncbi:MAG: DUF973 family protein [Thermoplasmata archaeon]